MTVCAKCKGTGEIQNASNWKSGYKDTVSKCPHCLGTGEKQKPRMVDSITVTDGNTVVVEKAYWRSEKSKTPEWDKIVKAVKQVATKVDFSKESVTVRWKESKYVGRSLMKNSVWTDVTEKFS